MMLKRSQKAACPASLIYFPFASSRFPHMPAQSCREPCGPSDLPWQPWAGKTSAIARHRENCQESIHHVQVGFGLWKIGYRWLQHVTVTLFESTMSRCPRARRFLFSQDFSSHFKSFLQCPLQVNLRVVWPTGMCQDEWSHANEQVRQDITITAWQRWLMQLGLIWLCLTCSINCTVIWKW